MSKMDELQEQMRDLQQKIKDEKMKDQREFGSRIQFARKANTDLTQLEVAELLGMTRTQYTNIETGQSWGTVKNIVPMCKLFKATPNEIFNYPPRDGG